MTAKEEVLSARGTRALNDSLIALGYPVLGANPHVKMTTPVVGDLPNAAVDRRGVAPIRFLFGRELEIWIGPYEIDNLSVEESTQDDLQAAIARILCSEVRCESSRWSTRIVLALPGQRPWRTVRIVGRNRVDLLEPQYNPYAR